MSAGIEFEKKYVLDTRKYDEIERLLTAKLDPPIFIASIIRQYYDKDGDRYRVISNEAKTEYVKEPKKSIKIGTHYSISVEADAQPVSREFFEAGWEKNRERRLQKIRYTVPGFYTSHKVMVDFFYNTGPDPRSEFYAIIAEVETMLTPETETLYLSLKLPIYLEQYCLHAVDDTDPAMKVFKSANLVDQTENITAVKRTISQWYD
jgi:hypothetical protein